MAGNFEDQLKDLIEPIVQSYGFELWGLRYRAGHNAAHLQIFIDGPEGVNADICGEITNALSPILDSADLINPAYVLEVSSPGIDRILFTKEQMAQYIGETIKVELKLAMQNRRKFEGKLISMSEDGSFVLLDKTSNAEVLLAFANISTARVVPDFSSLI